MKIEAQRRHMMTLSIDCCGSFGTRSELKRRDAEERQVVLVQEKNDLALQLQAVRRTKTCNPDI